MTDLPALWASDAWRADLDAWLRPALAAAGLTPAGPLATDRIRFWSTVLHVDTDGGRVWVKENAPSQAFEARLVAAVARLAPGRMAPVVAVDPDRGWLATRDLGTPVGEQDDVADDAWVELVSTWSRLQRDLVGHADVLLATGLSPFPESGAVAWATALADRLAALPTDDPRRLTAEEHARVGSGMPLVAAAAEALVASGLPPTLQHNDLHLHNALQAADGSMAFIDLGDAVWAHPLTALRIPLWTLAESRSGPQDPLVDRVLDAALEPWTDLSSPADLRALLPAADRVSCLHRALSWQRLLDDVPLAAVEPPDFLRASAEWLVIATAPDPYALAVTL